MGEAVYLRDPAAIVNAIRQAEGVPSYGNMGLRRQYGDHERVPEEVGRRSTARLVHNVYQKWVRADRPGDFLEYLGYGGPGYPGYAPLGATNDPTNLNRNWLPNVLKNLPAEPAGAAPALVPMTRGERERRAAAAAIYRPPPGRPYFIQGRGYVSQQELADIITGQGIVSPEQLRAMRERPSPFRRGVAFAIPGATGRIRAAQEEARQRAEAQGLRVEPPAPVTLRERVAEFAGVTTGFVLVSGPALGATVGRAVMRVAGPAIAKRVAPRVAGLLIGLARAGGEGAIFGVLDTAIGDYDELKQLPPDQAGRILATRAGVTGAEFAAFSAAFQGLAAAIRRGLVSVRMLREMRTEVNALAEQLRQPGAVLPEVDVRRLLAADRVAASRRQAAAEADRVIARGERARAGAPAAGPGVLVEAAPGLPFEAPPPAGRRIRARLPGPKERAEVERQAAEERRAALSRLRRVGGGVLMQRDPTRPLPEIELPPGVARPTPPEAPPLPFTPPEQRQVATILRPAAKLPPAPAPVPGQLTLAEAGVAQGPLRTIPLTSTPALAPPPAPAPLPRPTVPRPPATAAATVPVAPVPVPEGWAEVGRARTARDAEGLVASRQRQFPQLEVRARPVNPKRPNGVQILEARPREAGPAPQVPQEPVAAFPPTPAPPPPAEVLPAAAPVARGALTPEASARLRAALEKTAIGRAKAGRVPPAALEPLPALAPATRGRPSEVITERGTRIQTDFAVVEADQLVASHDVNLQPNPRFPAELQPRERTRAASVEQVNRISTRLAPELLGESPSPGQGAPIVGPDSVVESGNARVIALRRLYSARAPAEGGPGELRLPANAQLYRQWLTEHAADFGLDPAAIQGMRAPVLVRVRTTPLDAAARIRFTEEANIAATAAFSAVEQARADAGKMDNDLLGLWAEGSTDIDATTNRTFVRAFRDRVAPEDARFYDAQGGLSQEGRTRIRNALFARAYGAEDLSALARIAESTDDAVRTVSNAMIQAAPNWARLRAEADAGQVFPDLVINRALVRAANTLELIRQTPGVDVPTFLGQEELFGGSLGGLTSLERRILATFHEFSRSGKRLGEILQTYPEAVRAAGNPSQMEIITRGKPPNAEVTWEQAVDMAAPQVSQLVLTADLEAALDAKAALPRTQQVAVTDAIQGAMADYGREPRTLKAIDRLAQMAAKRYAGDPRAAQHPAGEDFFRRFIRAQWADTWDVMAEHSVATAYNEAVPFPERLSTATRNGEAIARRKRGGTGGPTLPPIGGAVEQRQTLGLELLEDLSAPSKELFTLGKILRRGLTESDKVVGSLGPEGVELAARKRAVDETWQLGAGEILGRMDRLLRAPDQVWNRVRAAREGTAVKLSALEQQVYDAIDPYFKDVLPRARQLGLDVGELENYWPIMLNERAEPRIGRIIEAIMARYGADFERAQTIARRLLATRGSTGRPFGNLERTREAWAPYDVRLSAKEEFIRYVQGEQRRLAEVRYYGPKDETINGIIGGLRERAPQDAAFVEAWFDAVTRKSPREAYLEGVARAVTNVQAATKMVLSVVSNASQPMNNLLVVNTKTFYRGLRAITSAGTREEALDFARRTGAVLRLTMRELVEQTAGTAEGSGEIVLRRTGFLTVEGGNRLLTASIGREWAKDLANGLVRAETAPSWLRTRSRVRIERQLRQVGLDPEIIVRQAQDATFVREHGGALTDVQQRLAALRLVELTQFRTDPGSLPLWWTSPWGRVLTQFKQFSFKQGQLVAQAVFGEARRGNFGPLMVFLTVFPLVGELVADTRLLLRRFPTSILQPSQVFAERPQNFWRRMAENYAFVGGLGLTSDLARALERRLPIEAVAAFIMGPTLSDLLQFINSSLTVIRGPRRGTGIRRAARQVVGLTVTPALVRAAGRIPVPFAGVLGSVAGEAIESSALLRTPPPPPSRQRRQRLRR